MGIDYNAILIYGIKNKWNKKKVKEVFGKMKWEDFQSFSIIYEDIKIYFCNIPLWYDCYGDEMPSFVGIRFYKSKDYSCNEIDLNLPMPYEIERFNKVLDILNIEKCKLKWYLMPQST